MFDRFLEVLNTSDATLSDIFRQHLHNPKLAYRDFARRIRALLNAESCAVFLVQKERSGDILELISEDSDTGYSGPSVKLPISSRKGKGLTSHLAKIGRIVRLNADEIENSPFLAGTLPLHLKSKKDYSLLSFPLKNRKGHLLGLVKVQNKKGKSGKATRGLRFTDTDVSLAAFLSNRLVVVLEGWALVSFLKAFLHGRRTPVNLPSFEATILHQALRLVGADRGVLALWDARLERLVVSAKVNDALLTEGDHIPKKSVMQTVWNNQKSISVADVRKYKGPYFSSNPKVRSEMAVLVSAQDISGQRRPLGVLNAESRLSKAFDVQDQIMLESAADSLGAAMDASQPELSLHRALASLSAPARVFAEPEKLLLSILERVKETYGFDRGLIYTAEEMSGLLRLGAQMGCDSESGRVGSYFHDLKQNSLAAYVWRQMEPVYIQVPSATCSSGPWEGVEHFV